MFEISNCKDEMNSTISSFVQDIKNIRTGRVSPDILKNLNVDSYGAKMSIPQLSNINNLDNMTLSINLWDSSLVNSVEKALLESNLGATPQTEGSSILLKFPELTSERRKELAKYSQELSEKYKISIRNIRRKFIDQIKNLEKEKSVSIDESKNFKTMYKNVLIILFKKLKNYKRQRARNFKSLILSNKAHHISLIMDGNHRWSEKNRLDPFDGYIKGSKKLLEISNYIFDNFDTQYITAFALSKNNLKRTNKKIKILKSVIRYFLEDLDSLSRFKFKISIKGNLGFLEKGLINKINDLNSRNLRYKKILKKIISKILS